MVAVGTIRLPAGGDAIPQIDVRDIAEVAVAALASDDPPAPCRPPGPAAVTPPRDRSRPLAEAAGHSTGYKPVAAEEFVRFMEPCFGAAYGEFLTGALARVASGELVIDLVDTVPRILGWSAYDVASFARHYRDLMV